MFGASFGRLLTSTSKRKMKQFISRLMLESLLIKRTISKTSCCGNWLTLYIPVVLPWVVLVLVFLLARIPLCTPHSFFFFIWFLPFSKVNLYIMNISVEDLLWTLYERHAWIFHFVQREVISRSLALLYNILVVVFFQDSNVKLIKELQLEIRSLKETLKVCVLNINIFITEFYTSV